MTPLGKAEKRFKDKVSELRLCITQMAVRIDHGSTESHIAYRVNMMILLAEEVGDLAIECGKEYAAMLQRSNERHAARVGNAHMEQKPGGNKRAV